MCAALDAMGVPDFGETYSRERITRLVSTNGARPCVLHGPSGCGKSIAAAQYASAAGRGTIWIDAAGHALTGSQLADSLLRGCADLCEDPGFESPTVDVPFVDRLEAVARAFSVAHQRRSCSCVVVDDLGAVIDESAVWEIHSLARALWRSNVHVVVTTRSLEGWPPDVLCGCGLLGPADLRLTALEAEMLLYEGGKPKGSIDASVLHEACGGHIAFFVVLSRQAREFGLEATVERTVSLEAWLQWVIERQLDIRSRELLKWAAALKAGSIADLEHMGLVGAASILEKISLVLPLVTVSRTADSIRAFRVHDLVDGYCADRFTDVDPESAHETLNACLRLLSSRREYARAAEVLIRSASFETTIGWLEEDGEAMLIDGLSAQLQRLFDQVPIALLMSHPRLLLLWADACDEQGCTEDALAKCRAAMPLAEHDGDKPTVYRAMAQCTSYLRKLNKLDAADELAQRILGSPPGEVSSLYVAEALFCIGHSRMLRGDLSSASKSLTAAQQLAVGERNGQRVSQIARRALALLPALGVGDFVSTSRMLSPMVHEDHQFLSSRVRAKGNLAICLVEFGRLGRSEHLLRAALGDAQANGLDLYLGAYLPALGCVRVAQGEVSEGVQLVRDGVMRAVVCGDQAGADEGRVFLAVVLRAAGDFDESLCEAERAFERLSVADSMNFRRLAALEVAASLLALGDLAAARSWVGTVLDEGFSGNLYHALRAEMILAEIDRLEGRLGGAVERLKSHIDYVLSENPSWQIAMYCRAFPALIGLFALAVGVDRLPSHMLRMILPEHAERCLGETRAFIDDVTWRRLGIRLLGEEELAAYLRRDGLPLCHVRLFGGLDINVGGRNVRERDWKKRKARLLFAMLVIRRGQDVARDQLFEYLWPGMEEERAKNNLYVVWSAMKSVLMGKGERGGKCPYVESVGGVCRSVRETVRTDVDDFQAALIAARDAEAAKNAVDALRAYERIADLYRGDLLPGDCYDDWFANLREHYRSEFVDAMLRGTQLLMGADDPGNALIFSRRAIQCDPFREDLYQAALRCQIAAGQRSSAIDTYLQCRDRLADELGLDPSVETRALYDEILAMEDRPRPTPIDPFVG